MTYQDNGYNPRVGYTQQFALVGEAVDPRWDNLIAGWTMDESSDGSGAVSRADVLGNYTLTDNNTTASRTGKISNAPDFVPGDSTKLTNTSSEDFAMLTGGGPRTFSFWKLNDVLSSNYVMACMGESAGSQQGAWSMTIATGGTITFGISDVGGTWRNFGSTSQAPNIGEWYHIVCWLDATGKHHIAINGGTPDDWFSTMTLATNAGGSIQDLTFGAYPTFGFYLDGGVDEFYLFSDVKDSAWRTAMYNAGAGRVYPG